MPSWGLTICLCSLMTLGCGADISLAANWMHACLIYLSKFRNCNNLQKCCCCILEWPCQLQIVYASNCEEYMQTGWHKGPYLFIVHVVVAWLGKAEESWATKTSSFRQLSFLLMTLNDAVIAGSKKSHWQQNINCQIIFIKFRKANIYFLVWLFKLLWLSF